MPTERKETAVAQLEERFKRAKALVFTGFHGVKASEMVELRATLSKSHLEYRVIKNSLAILAAKRAGLEIEPLFQGETGICFGYDDPVLAFKLTSELAKKYSNYKIRGGVSEGQAINEQGALELAKLPSREVLLTQLAVALQGPIRKLATALSALLREPVAVLAEIEKVKGTQAPPAPSVTTETETPAETEGPTNKTEGETEKGAETKS
jgi:ribosomal protein L10